MPNEIDVKNLRELESKATPGPWKYDTDTDYIWGPQMQMVASDINGTTMRGVGEGLPIDINGELMCEARNALPALLDRIEELEKKDAAWQESYKAEHLQWRDALSEFSALKAKMEKVRNLADKLEVIRAARLLSILDGKEG